MFIDELFILVFKDYVSYIHKNFETEKMQMFVCKRCNYEAKLKTNLKRHLQRVKVCEPIDDEHDIPIDTLLQELERKYNDNAHTCKWCDKKFNTATNMYAHCRRFHKENDTKENTSSNQSNDLLIDLAKKMVDLMQNASTSHAQQPISITQTFNIQNIGQQNNINIHPIGQENLEHISKEMMDTFVKDRQIIDFVKTLNFNPAKPENHNVKRITTSKDWYKNQFLACFEESVEGEFKWQHSPAKSVLHSVICKALGRAMNHLNLLKAEGQLDRETQNIIDDWFINAGTNPKQFYKDVFALMLDDDTFVLKKNEINETSAIAPMTS